MLYSVIFFNFFLILFSDLVYFTLHCRSRFFFIFLGEGRNLEDAHSPRAAYKKTNNRCQEPTNRLLPAGACYASREDKRSEKY